MKLSRIRGKPRTLPHELWRSTRRAPDARLRLSLAGRDLAVAPVAHVLEAASTHRRWRRWATGEEMKVVLVLVLVLLAAATALAYGNATVATSVTAAAVQVADRTERTGRAAAVGQRAARSRRRGQAVHALTTMPARSWPMRRALPSSARLTDEFESPCGGKRGNCPMSRVLLAAQFVALASGRGGARRADLALRLNSATGGFTQSGDIAAVGTTIDLGTLFAARRRCVGHVLLQRRRGLADYTLTFDLAGLTGVAGDAVRGLDPTGRTRRRARSGGASRRTCRPGTRPPTTATG